MSMKTVVVGVASVFVLVVFALVAVHVSLAMGPLDPLEQFHAACLATFNGADTSPQTGSCKGNLIGGAATITWELDNVFIAPGYPISTSNGPVACASKAGVATITTTKGDTLSLALGGSGCSGVPVGVGTGNSEVAYWITGGTGRFVGAKGSGTFALGFDNITGGTATVNLDGEVLDPLI